MRKIISTQNDYQQAGQGQVLKYVQKLGGTEQERILNRLQSFDIKQMNLVYQQYKSKTIQSSSFEAVQCIQFQEADAILGYQMISEGKRITLIYQVAIVISAQQNLSLLDIQLPSHKCLFQLYCERIWSLQNLTMQQCGKCPPILLFVMTTSLNHEMITLFFSEKQFFGLQEDQIFFIQQEQLPLLSMDGSILFRNEQYIFEEHIGNGFIFLNQTILDTMKCLGVTILHLCSVENVLCKFGDPYWIGAFIRSQLFLSAKCVQKRKAEEKLGIIVQQQGLVLKGIFNSRFRYDEIQYNDLVRKDKNGQLVNQNGCIGQLLCSLDYAIELCKNYKLNLLSKQSFTITLASTLDKRNLTQPQLGQPNSLKFELTYFDALPYCPIQQFGLFKVKREDEYSAILNPSNEVNDTIHTAREAYLKRDQKWMAMIGYEVHQEFEISPKLTYFGENLEEAARKQVNQKQNKFAPLILHSDRQIRTNRVSSQHDQINFSPTRQSQKMSVHQSLNQFQYKTQITNSLVTPHLNHSFQFSDRKSIQQQPQRMTDYRPNQMPRYFVPTTYYQSKK